MNQSLSSCNVRVEVDTAAPAVMEFHALMVWLLTAENGVQVAVALGMGKRYYPGRYDELMQGARERMAQLEGSNGME